MNIKLIETIEGKIKLKVPDIKFYSGEKLEPAWAPIFYNPRMRTARDIDVALIEAYSSFNSRGAITVCEPLSATGVRGLRYAAEVNTVEKVVINDKVSKAYMLELENAKLNGLLNKVEVYNREARALLLELAEKGVKFDVVDIDPFGSPVPFTEAALLAIKHKGMLCVTATDLAPLFGVKTEACKRKYFAIPLQTEFSKEIGARIMLGFVARQAAKLGLGVHPLFTALIGHALRLSVLIKRSRSSAIKSLNLIGLARYCCKCFYRDLAEGLILRSEECPQCGTKLSVGGPLWIGPLWDPGFCKLAHRCYEKHGYLSSKGLKVMRTVASESQGPSLYTTVTVIARLLGSGDEPSVQKVINDVTASGKLAIPTHFDSKGVRCNIQPIDLIKLLK
ncbi:MAG: tRNA (guanine(26)-N(2))-dimethyltransferase [Thermofilaceae archaeon]